MIIGVKTEHINADSENKFLGLSLVFNLHEIHIVTIIYFFNQYLTSCFGPVAWKESCTMNWDFVKMNVPGENSIDIDIDSVLSTAV